jgi:hypothetical protein
MNAPSATAPLISCTDIVHDPMFCLGYDEIWRGQEQALSVRWNFDEAAAYIRGRKFGLFVLDYEHARVALLRAGNIHPRALVLFTIALQRGALE